MSAGEGVVGDGLQAERTALAWRRTALAVAVGAVGCARLASPALGAAAYALGAAGLAQALAVAVVSHRRYRAVHTGLARDGSLAPSGGLPFLGMAATTFVLSGLALAFLTAG